MTTGLVDCECGHTGLREHQLEFHRNSREHTDWQEAQGIPVLKPQPADEETEEPSVPPPAANVQHPDLEWVLEAMTAPGIEPSYRHIEVARRFRKASFKNHWPSEEMPLNTLEFLIAHQIPVEPPQRETRWDTERREKNPGIVWKLS